MSPPCSAPTHSVGERSSDPFGSNTASNNLMSWLTVTGSELSSCGTSGDCLSLGRCSFNCSASVPDDDPSLVDSRSRSNLSLMEPFSWELPAREVSFFISATRPRIALTISPLSFFMSFEGSSRFGLSGGVAAWAGAFSWNELGAITTVWPESRGYNTEHVAVMMQPKKMKDEAGKKSGMHRPYISATRIFLRIRRFKEIWGVM